MLAKNDWPFINNEYYFGHYLWLLPLFLGFLIPFTCCLSYWLAVRQGFVDALLPYVSDAASSPCSASHFSQLTDLCFVLFIMISWIRYKQIQYYLNQQIIKNNKQELALEKRLCCLNGVFLRSAIVSSIGGISLGNYRITEFVWIHLFSSIVLYVFIIVCMVLMTYISYELHRNYHIESHPTTMFFTTIIGLVIGFMFGLFSTLLVQQIGLDRLLNDNFRRHFPSDHIGFYNYCLTTSSEWMLLFTMTPYLFCIANRMKHFQQYNQIHFYSNM